VLTDDPEEFRRMQEATLQAAAGKADTLACAGIAIESGLAFAQAAGLMPHFLNYTNSSSTHPETSQRVVGYGSFAFTGPPGALEEGLDKAAQSEAMNIAGQTLAAYFNGKDYDSSPKSPVLAEKRGVFVTLNKNGELRGCVGVFAPAKSLAESIREMALAAAFHDERFPPLNVDELPNISIEISVLSPLVRVSGPTAIELGRDGVYLVQGEQAGVFLPQVATQTGWTKEEFLGALCSQKAGLPADCWRDSKTEFYTFTAQVFD